MNLSADELAWRKSFMQAYQGHLPGVDCDDDLCKAMLDGTESEQKALLKTFLEDIILPIHEAELLILQANVAYLEATVATEQAYVDA